jgi:diguanylate cyclase (GGDEF)-like protein/PAS domain S-box-containing protein
MGVSNYADTDLDRLRKRISRLETENRVLVETCDTLSDTQSALERLIGASNEKLLAAEMLSMELEQVFSSCADATWVVRQDGIVVRANRAMLRFLGLPQDDVIVGRRCKDLLDASICREGTCPLSSARKARSFHEFDIERRNDSGELEYYLVSTSSLVTLDGSPGIVAQFKDITLRKRAEAALERANVTLERLASIDGLTQVPNRRSFDEAVAKEWLRLTREQAPLSVILCDIDCFKKYNDHYGHQAGDDCLRQVAQALAGSVGRSVDLVARYGGEEFVCLLPETELSGAATKARQLVRDIEDLRIPHEASMTANSVTLSIGVASVTPNRIGSAAELVATADAQLYRAKRTGRNRVAALQDEPCLGTWVKEELGVQL